MTDAIPLALNLPWGEQCRDLGEDPWVVRTGGAGAGDEVTFETPDDVSVRILGETNHPSGGR